MAGKKERIFIQVQIDPDKKGKFASKVEQEGKRMTDVVLDWIDNYLNETDRVDVVALQRRVEALENVLKDNATLVGESNA